MKKSSFLILAVICLLQAKSQLAVNLQLPPVALTLKNQLWNMTLVNTSGQTMRLKVDITFIDVTNNLTVMTGSSTEFDLAAGTRQMQANDFLPITYNVTSTNYNIDNSPGGFLPIGHFNVCYQFSRYSTGHAETLTEECETVEIEPLSPPILVFPEDEAVIETTRPVFNWIPPAPANLFSNLTYDLKLVEVVGSQVPADAIQQNIALFSAQSVNAPTTVYPSGLPALDTGKLYAWQVTAKSNGSFIAKSDTWVFRLASSENDVQLNQAGEAFAKLRLNMDANYFLCKGTLRFYYDNHSNDDSVKISIFDLNEPQTALLKDDKYALQPGQNLKELDLQDMPGFTNNHYYRIELVNSRQEKWEGRFLYKKDN
jgi:hypothetical protein